MAEQVTAALFIVGFIGFMVVLLGFFYRVYAGFILGFCDGFCEVFLACLVILF